MSSAASLALFQPIQVGNIQLSHRVVLSPCGRLRANKAHEQGDIAVEYYKQRASVPGTLLIAEATLIAPQAGGLRNVPGIYTVKQIAAWKKITDAVHNQGSFIYLQLCALGRVAYPAVLQEEDPDFDHVAPSPIPLKSRDEVPRELTKAEIKQYIEWYRTAAQNAVHHAGFDGVELHACNADLIDQFLQDVSNQRSDEYGGSIENRARFALEVVHAIVEAIGQTKGAIRLSPWSTNRDMRMQDPIPTFTYLVEQLKQRYPDLAYLHTITPRGPFQQGPQDESEADFIYRLWAPRIAISTGGHNRETALNVAEESGRLIGFGQDFIANPDLPFRLQHNIPLNAPDPSTFSAAEQAEGYTTYPFSEEFLKSLA